MRAIIILLGISILYSAVSVENCPRRWEHRSTHNSDSDCEAKCDDWAERKDSYRGEAENLIDTIDGEEQTVEKVVKFYDYFKMECFGEDNGWDCCEENSVTKTKRVTQWYQIDDNHDRFADPYKSEAKWLKDWGYETDNSDTDVPETESDGDNED